MDIRQKLRHRPTRNMGLRLKTIFPCANVVLYRRGGGGGAGTCLSGGGGEGGRGGGGPVGEGSPSERT